jgi:hypothetical protein
MVSDCAYFTGYATSICGTPQKWLFTSGSSSHLDLELWAELSVLLDGQHDFCWCNINAQAHV